MTPHGSSDICVGSLARSLDSPPSQSMLWWSSAPASASLELRSDSSDDSHRISGEGPIWNRSCHAFSPRVRTLLALSSQARALKVSTLSCGLQTGAGSVLNLIKPTPKSSIAVYGIGAVGVGAILAAKYLGVETSKPHTPESRARSLVFMLQSLWSTLFRPVSSLL